MNPSIVNIPAWLEQKGQWALRAGLVALGLWAVCALFAPRAVLFSYLCGLLLWSGIPLGCGALLMLHHLVGGRWGRGLRPPMEAAAVTTPLLALLFIPVALGLSTLYPWAGAAVHEEWMAPKRGYLNVPFFLIRAAAFLVLWGWGGWLLFRQSSRPARAGAGGEVSYSQRLAAPGLLIYVFTVSFAAIDWIGSLEPQWYSSIFGLYILIGQAISGMAVLIVLATIPHASKDADSLASETSGLAGILQDLGTLLLAMVCLHAYFAYSQFFIIWNGNLPHEIHWYLPRIRGGWGFVALVLIVIHFALPFALLLSRDLKRRASSLLKIAVVVLVARCIEVMWIVLPSYEGPVMGVVLLTVLTMLGLGGVWIGAFAFGWRMRTALVRDNAQVEDALA